VAKEFLEAKAVPFKEYNVVQDRAALKEMVEISGGRSVPVIVGCNQVLVGFNASRLEQMIECLKNRSEVK
jgi:glutaredoxin